MYIYNIGPNIMSVGEHIMAHGTYRIMGYIRSRNFRTDTGKLNFESFIFIYVPYSNNVLYSNN